MATQFDLKKGLTVRTSDGDKLGKIINVKGDTFLVEKGIFFPKDYTAKTDQIARVTDDGVYMKFGTHLVEQSFDQLYGAGSYQKETEMPEWREYSPAKRTSEKYAEGTDTTIPVSEEQLSVERKGMQETGRVRVHKSVKTEEKHFTVPITKEEVTVERTPPQGAKPAEPGAFKQETTSIPIREEKIEVTKRPVTTEEVHVRTEQSHEERPVSGEVRREEVKVEEERGGNR